MRRHGTILCRKRRHLVTPADDAKHYCPQCARNARRRRVKPRKLVQAADEIEWLTKENEDLKRKLREVGHDKC